MAEEYVPYPVPEAHRSGCKVSWHYYKTIGEAIVASEAAKHNAEIDARKGYDFGFCYPGNIHKISELAKNYAGLYEVCTC